MSDTIHIVAIINVTPDSFSDGGLAASPEAALQRVQACIDEGADVLDIGAESTRPQAVLLDAEDEWQRLEPVLAQAVSMAHRAGRKVSVDTRHAATAAKALEAGVDIINVQAGLEHSDMAAVLRDSACKVVMMHHLGMPANPAVTIDEKADVVKEVTGALACMAEDIGVLGIAPSRLLCDVGIGFGKTKKQSLELIAHAGKIQHALGMPLYVGHSRKSFLTLFSDAQPQDRDELTLLCSGLLMAQGIRWLRVHDVARHVALKRALI